MKICIFSGKLMVLFNSDRVGRLDVAKRPCSPRKYMNHVSMCVLALYLQRLEVL